MSKALDIVATSLILAMAVLPAWFFGGIQPSSQCWLFLGVAITAAICALRVGLTRSTITWPWLLLPLAMGLTLAALQTVPLPPGVLAAASPRAVQLWTEMGAADRDSEELPGTPSVARPVSLYPANTHRDFALLGLLTAVVLLAANCAHVRQLRVVVLVVLAVNGAAVAGFGILQQLTWDGKLYWSVPLTQGGEPFASFVNRNHAAGYLNLCLAGAIGLMVWALARQTYSRDAEYEAAIRKQLRAVRKEGMAHIFFGSFDRVSLIALGLAAVTTAGILSSLSRGGILSLVVAALVTSVGALRTAAARRTVAPTVTMAVVGLCLALWLGRGDLLRARFADSLYDQSTAVSGRLAHWQDAGHVVRDFWRTGSGLGTYRYVYRPYESRFINGWYYHAENQYLEALVEMGICGGALLLAALWLAWRCCRQLLANQRSATDLAIGSAALFALTSQAVHAFFDFGLYMPSNATALAILCGLASTRALPWQTEPGSSTGGQRLLMVVTLIAVGVSMLIGFEMRRYDHRQATAMASFEGWNGQQPLAPETLSVQLDVWQALAAERPHDAVTQQRLATLCELEYRALVCQSLQSETGGRIDPQELWQLSATIHLNRRIHQLQQANDAPRLAALKSQPVIRCQLLSAATHLRRACQACPLLADAHLKLGELCVAVDRTNCDVRHLQHALALSPHDPDTLFAAGLLHLNAGRLAAGLAVWQICLETSSRYDIQITTAALQLAHPQILVTQLLPESPWRLITLARRCFRNTSASDLQFRLANKIEQHLAETACDSAEKNYLTAVAAEFRGHQEAALSAYERAVALRPDQVSWRYDWAVALGRSGHWPEALRQARRCVRMQPQSRRYQDLAHRAEKAVQRDATGL